MPKCHYLVIDMTPVHHVDSMGLHLLEDLVFESKRKGMQLLLANPSKSVSPTFRGEKWLVTRSDTALAAISWCLHTSHNVMRFAALGS